MTSLEIGLTVVMVIGLAIAGFVKLQDSKKHQLHH